MDPAMQAYGQSIAQGKCALTAEDSCTIVLGEDDSLTSLQISSSSLSQLIENQNVLDFKILPTQTEAYMSSLEISSLSNVEINQNNEECVKTNFTPGPEVLSSEVSGLTSSNVATEAEQKMNKEIGDKNCEEIPAKAAVSGSADGKQSSKTIPKVHNSYQEFNAFHGNVCLGLGNQENQHERQPFKKCTSHQNHLSNKCGFDESKGIGDFSNNCDSILPTVLYDLGVTGKSHSFTGKGEELKGTKLAPNILHTPQELRQYTPPRPTFQKTIVFEEILDQLEHGHKIIHLHGMSGTGKSQIVRGICKVLDESNRSYLLWHMQCQDGSNLLKLGLERLIDKLDDCSIIDVILRRTLLEELQNNRTKTLVNKLTTLHTKILLVIEDITDDEKVLARSLVQSLSTLATQSLQILIASPRKDVLYTEEDIDAMNYYYTKRVNGFIKPEAVAFLTTGNINRKGAEQLAEALAYSPLRLTLAKNYCRKYRESYQSYFDGLGKDETVIEKEKQILNLHPDLAKCHGYEVIMKALRPRSKVEKEDLQFLVIEMMSFLNNENISDYLLGKFFQQVQPMVFREEQRMVQCLKARLEDDCDMDVHSFSDKIDYGEQLISTHKDILLAIHLYIPNEKKQRILMDVLQAIASLIKKENRYRTDSNLLFSLQNHMDSVVSHAKKLLKGDFLGKSMKQNDFDIQLGLARMYEVLGFVVQRHLNTKDIDLEKATNYLSNVICAFNTKKDKRETLFKYTPKKDPAVTAKKIYKIIKEANKKIPDVFILQNWAKLFPITENHLKVMAESAGNESKLDWEDMVTALRLDGHLNSDHIRQLEREKMLLNPKQIKSVYICERLMSVLHTRSRQVLYLQNSISKEEQNRYEWYSDVGLYLSENLFCDTGISSLFRYLLKANSKLPRMLNNCLNEDDASFIARIEAARKYAQSLTDGKERFYEHGLYKRVYGTAYSNMNLLRFLVKANTKLHKRRHIANVKEVTNQMLECDRFFNLAKQNVQYFVVASNCIVQAGKYYAAVGKYETALEAFECAFDHHGYGIEYQCDKYPNAYAWALHNVGMTLCKSEKELANFTSHKEKFFLRYQTAVKCNICKEWRRDLLIMKKLVESLH
ncbi:uncharacterized protein LOC120345199 isoform X2 [Styela clava]